MLPEPPNLDELADACREIAATQRLQAVHVEKDFQLTRLIWAIAEQFGENLLLKGGTCLSKVDHGFHRMSEDADFVVSRDRVPSGRDREAKFVFPLLAKIRRVTEAVGFKMVERDYRLDKVKLKALFRVEYASRLEANDTGSILVEVSFRPILRPPRRASLRQLLVGPLATGYGEAFCWALDGDEVRAEKVRAAFTREEIRDFYDLQLFMAQGSDMKSDDFRSLVDTKLTELQTAPLSRQHINFGKSASQLQELRKTIDTRLAVVRSDDKRFDLDSVLNHFNGLWALRT